MTRIQPGILCGLIFGALSAASMLPMQVPDKRAALIGAFFNRFAICLIIGFAVIPGWRWAIGLLIGILISLPDAIIIKAHAPILLFGALGGTLIGWIVARFSH